MEKRFALWFLLLGLWACAGDGSSTTEASEAENPAQVTEQQEPRKVYSFENQDWVLTGMVIEGTERVIKADSIALTARFTGGIVRGFAGCNDFLADYSIAEDSTLTIGNMQKSGRMCSGRMTQEIRYLEVLESGNSFDHQNFLLQIKGEKGILKFNRKDQ